MESESTDIMDIKHDNDRRSMIAANDSIKADESFEQLTTNEDDDFVIPETQDLLSQNSIEELKDSSSVVDCDKTDISIDSKDTTAILKAIKQHPNVSRLQSNVSIVSISSDEGAETSTAGQNTESNVALNSEDLFGGNCDAYGDVEVKTEEQSFVAVAKSDEQSFVDGNGELHLFAGIYMRALVTQFASQLVYVL